MAHDQMDAPTVRRIVRWYEVVGGFAGVTTMTWITYQHALPFRVWAGFAIPFGLVAAAGWMVRPHEGSGDGLSFAIQLPQVLFWSIGHSVWKFCSGAYATISIVGTQLRFYVGLDTTITHGWATDQQPFILGVNLVPLAVIAALFWSRRPLREPARAVVLEFNRLSGGGPTL